MNKVLANQQETFKAELKVMADILFKKNKRGYMATPVACGWAGAIFEFTGPYGQEQ